MAALIIACCIGFFNGWATFVRDPSTGNFDWRTFIVDYIGFPMYLAMILGYKFLMKTEGVRPEDVDLFGGKAKVGEDETEFLARELRRKGGLLETKYQRLYKYTLGDLFYFYIWDRCGFL